MSALPNDPAGMSLDALAAACRRESARYKASRTNDPTFCLELFRRACRQPDRDEAAWAMLVPIYSNFIRAQLNNDAARFLSREDLEQRVWLKLWQRVNGGAFAVNNLEGVLSYLKVITVSVVMDAKREQDRRQVEQLFSELAQQGSDDPDDDLLERRLPASALDSLDQIKLKRVWERIRELLTDPIEIAIFVLRHNDGYKPKEIAEILARRGRRIKQQPPTARLVSRILEEIIRRLGDDPEIRDLLSSD